MSSERIEMECPECGHKLRVTVQHVIHERTVTCPGGHSIRLKDEGHVMRDMERELRKLDKNFRL